MKFLEFFKKDQLDIKKSYLKQLIKVAKADGELETNEYDFILKVAKRLDSSEAEVQDVEKNLQTIVTEEPSGEDERFQFLYDLVWIMMVDTEIDKQEEQLCTKMADRLGFKPELVKNLIAAIQRHTNQGLEEDTIYQMVQTEFVG